MFWNTSLFPETCFANTCGLSFHILSRVSLNMCFKSFFIKSIVLITFLCVFCILSKKSLPRSFIALSLTFTSMIHSNLIFVYGIR